MVRPALRIWRFSGLDWFPNIQAANAASNRRASMPPRRPFNAARIPAYGILQFIMRHTVVLIATLGAFLLAAGQAAKKQPPATPTAPAQLVRSEEHTSELQ